MSQDESYAAGISKLSTGKLEDSRLWESGLYKKRKAYISDNDY